MLRKARSEPQWPFPCHRTIRVHLLACRSYARSSSPCPPLPPLQLAGSVLWAAEIKRDRWALRKGKVTLTAASVHRLLPPFFSSAYPALVHVGPEPVSSW